MYYAPASRPLLLLLNGHKSHYCPEFICRAAEEGVIVFTLPPNTTHLSQPLDKGPFSPLKCYWRKVVQNFTLKTRRAVTRYNFSALFAEAWSKAMTLKNIMSGFETTGIYPFNPKALVPEETFTEFHPEELSKSTGIKFIPLYSPSRIGTVSASASDRPSCISESVSSPDLDPHSCDSSLLDESLMVDTITYQETTLQTLSSEKCHRSVCDNSMSQTTSQSLHEQSDKCEHKVDGCYLPVKRGRVLTKFISTPCLPSRIPVKNPKSCGKVLTSREQLKIMDEKSKKKERG